SSISRRASRNVSVKRLSKNTHHERFRRYIMTNKYNVQLITDVNGKPMPQYYDETEGVMKPITRDNGEIMGDVNANVSFPETQNINGTVSVDNFPATQQVEVTNQKEVQDVNVTNQAT